MSKLVLIGGYVYQTVECNVIDVTPDVTGQFSLALVTPEGKMPYMELWLICVIYRVTERRQLL